MSEDKGALMFQGVMAYSVTEDKEHTICQRIKAL